MIDEEDTNEESKRKLVTIQTIENIESIEGKDRIVKATILGWNVVVAKDNNYKEGQKIIYAEYNSLLPDGPEWAEFMREKKFRIKTIKLGGCLSQGLVFPTSILPGAEEMEIDTDVTGLLGIKKYEQIFHEHNGGAKQGKAKGNFPACVPKTDEIRLQAKKRLIEELKAAGSFYISIKLDGMSGTFCYDNDEFCACSRKFKKHDDDINVFWKMARKYNLPEVLKGTNLAAQGEMVGPGIQGNKLCLTEVDWRVFDLFDITNQKYCGYEEMVKFCKDNGLTTVPIENVITDTSSFDFSLEAWLKRAEGLYEGTKRNREGIVVRPLIITHSNILQGRLSFKVINNQFLLENKE